MVDFLKLNPYMTMNDYMYNISVPKLILMASDYTRVEYLSEKQAKERDKIFPDVVVSSDEELMKYLK